MKFGLLHQSVESLRMAFQSIWANKMRSVLTTLGVIIGVTTVIAIVSIIQGANKAFTEEISFIGSNTLYVQKHSWIMSNEEWWKIKNRKDIGIKELKAIEEQSRYSQYVSPVMASRRKVRYKNNVLQDVIVFGSNEDFDKTENFNIEYGRYLSAEDVRHNRHYCVLGSKIAEELFDVGFPIGEKIKIGPMKFKIIGVLEKKGDFFGQNIDNRVIIPYELFMKLFGSNRDITILVKVLGVEYIESAKDELTGILRRVRKVPPTEENDFAINQQDALTDMYRSLTTGLYATAIGVGALSLIVGGIGIMNIMLVSVTERTKEIGIRKSIGAKTRNVLWQFLIESIAISGLGGGLGIAIGFILAGIISSSSPLPATISITSIIIGFGFSTTVGVFFGIYPAYKAGKLNPIEALRYE